MGNREVDRYFVTCGRGIEPVLAEELSALGASEVEQGRGGVHFSGDRRLLYKANLFVRTAVRILKPILEVEVHSPDELYEAVGSLDWQGLMTPSHTLAVDANVRDSKITHSKYAALRVKDAICDQFLDRRGRRPSVDVANPAIGLNLHIYRDRAVLSLDSSGDSLHKRGYRPIQTKAPLNEALAAALVLMTGWRGESAFVDPLCGSGTIPIEAAWIALNRPPGLTRKRFGFQGWLDFDVQLWTSVRDEAREQVRRKLAAPILGYDLRGDAVTWSRNNARSAGIGNHLQFERADVRDFSPSESSGVILCNPPYGERIGNEKELRPLYRALGEVFSARCAGWSAFVFTGNPKLGREIGIEPKRRTQLFNGRIRCELLEFEMT